MENLVGRKYHELLVISFHDIKNNKGRWKCKCNCGSETITYGCFLIGGVKQKCEGCYDRRRATK
jgi:hypothetical protein